MYAVSQIRTGRAMNAVPPNVMPIQKGSAMNAIPRIEETSDGRRLGISENAVPKKTKEIRVMNAVS